MTPTRFAIVGATALGGEELRHIEDAAVLVEDGTIADIGPASDVSLDVVTEPVDASGLTLVPGFIDAHVHIGLANPADVLRGGVTTVRDLAWPHASIWRLVRASSGSLDGPRILAAGQMLTVEGGYPTRAPWAPPGTGRVVRGPDDAHDAVAEQAGAGATVIKVALNAEVGPTLDEVTLGALVAAAHDLRLKVTGHVYGLGELDKALRAGLDELAHMLMSPERIPDDVLSAMVTNGVTVVPTLSIFFGDAQEIAIDNLGRFLGAGGNVVYGTDLGNQGPKPGIDRREIKAMAAAGMSGRAIIASATTESAKWLGLGGTGRLSPGMAADFVAVDGDPLLDPAALTRVIGVWRAGRSAS